MMVEEFHSVVVEIPGVKILQKEHSFVMGIFGCALGQNFWFLVGKLQNFHNFLENN